MRLLLDTHIVYWYFYDDCKLPARAREIMKNADGVYVSSASLWEISIKVKIGKMRADPELMAQNMDEGGFLELPVEFRHAVQVSTLPLFHSDPFDRMLVAQAIREEMWLLTADSRLPKYSDLVLHV